MTVADLLELRAVDEAAIDSAGSAVAIVVQRARRPGEPIAGESLYGGNVRADVLVLRASDGKELFTTHGGAERAGYWRPVWAPSGNLLAMLELQADTLSICVWSRDSGRMSCVPGDGSVDFLSRWTAVASTDGSQRNNTPFAWLDDSTIAYVLLPRGIVDQASSHSHAVGDSVAAMWSREQAGRISTVSVLETPWPAASLPPAATLRVENVVSGESRTIGPIPYLPSGRRSVILSPDSARAIVLADREPHNPPPGRLLGFSNQVRIHLGVAVLSHGGTVSWAPALPYDRGARWMGTGGRFGATVKRSYDQDVERGDRLAFVDATSGTIDSIAGPISGDSILRREPGERRDVVGCTITPEPGERLLATARRCEFGVVLRRTSRETKVIEVWPHTDSSRTLLAINQGIENVADPVRSSIRYTARDGSVQFAVLLLPPGFTKGVKYPLVAWIYPGML
jgi:dipeptidyl aminopeptidase/acylaminoacyl peptidase